MVRTFSSFYQDLPLLIAVTETVLKAQASPWWETESKQVESALRLNHPPFSMCYFNKSAYCRYSAISGTTTGTLLLLTVTVHILHWTAEKTFTVKVTSHQIHLHHGKIAAVSVRYMRVGSYAISIALITFCIL